MLPECPLFTFAILTFNLSSGDSSAAADINLGGDGSGNPNSHSFANQINEPGNSLSSANEAHSSLRGYATGMSLVYICAFNF